jgi:hypothetical protein
VNLDLARVITRALEISWRHRWLWVLGVFGGGGGTLAGLRAVPFGGRDQGADNAAATVSQVEALLAHNSWIVGLVVGAVVLVVVVAFLFSCVAVPGAIWAGLNLDGGREVGLGMAWREGLRRFGPFLRLNLLRLLIGLLLAAPAAVSGLSLLGSLGSGRVHLVGSVLLLVVSLLFSVAGSILLAVALVWSERLIVISGAGALSSMRQSWWLVRRALVDTVLFAVLMGFLAGAIGLGVTAAAVVVALPGIVAALVGFSTVGPLFLAGVGWIAIMGLAVLLIGGGFVGALVQVAYALACRDLCRRHGIEVVATLAAAGPPPASSQPVPVA